MRFSIRPRTCRFIQVKEWLEEEYSSSYEGFFCNINLIERAFNNGDFCCVTSREETLAFCIFSRYENEAEIAIAEVHPSKRGEGVGKFLVGSFLDYMENLGVLAVSLECMPFESEHFWKSVGFTDIPLGVDKNARQAIRLYRPTVDVENVSGTHGEQGVIELWDCEPWQASDKNPKWTWPLNLAGNKLRKKIVHPVNRDWQVCWRKKGKMLRQEKVKYFCEQTRYSSRYFILNELPII